MKHKTIIDWAKLRKLAEDKKGALSYREVAEQIKVDHLRIYGFLNAKRRLSADGYAKLLLWLGLDFKDSLKEASLTS